MLDSQTGFTRNQLGMSALVTGGANGIGRAISLALAKKGLFVTILDFSEQKGNEIAPLIEAENKRFLPDITFPSVTFIKCDVTNSVELSAAFARHVETYGGLDVSVHSAGVGVTDTSFDEDETDGVSSWRRIISINFTALVDCTRIATQTMRELKKPGAVMNMGSAAGLYPVPADPIYSASKGGVVLFTRSCALLAREGIRVNALCPEFVNTDAIYEKNLHGWRLFAHGDYRSSSYKLITLLREIQRILESMSPNVRCLQPPLRECWKCLTRTCACVLPALYHHDRPLKSEALL